MKSSLVAVATFLALATPTQADYDAGVAALEDGKYERALSELEPVAKAGDARAQYVLGILHGHGIGIEPAPKQGLTWLKKAAEADFIPAQLELARIYEVGDGVAPDDRERAKWYERAAELGDVGAQVAVADTYATGQGVEKDLVAAYMWYEVASRYWGDMLDAPKQLIATQMTPEEVETAKKRAEQAGGEDAR